MGEITPFFLQVVAVASHHHPFARLYKYEYILCLLRSFLSSPFFLFWILHVQMVNERALRYTYGAAVCLFVCLLLIPSFTVPSPCFSSVEYIFTNITQDTIQQLFQVRSYEWKKKHTALFAVGWILLFYLILGTFFSNWPFHF
jgi:hypothetical protein